MRCPVCDESLRVVEKYGVEIDICPGCKGVWLDRGELEKVMELVSAGGPEALNASRDFDPHRTRAAQAGGYRERRPEPERRYEPERSRDDYSRDEHGRPRHKKKESWFGEIFDAFGGD